MRSNQSANNSEPSAIDRLVVDIVSDDKPKRASEYCQAIQAIADLNAGLAEERQIGPGVKLVRYKAKHRLVNPDTGIPGVASGDVRVVIDWTNREFAK